MKNYVQAGDNISVTAPSDIAAGDGVLIGSLFGIAVNSALTGETVTLVTKGVFELNKTSAQAWTLGIKVYWSGTECTTTASGNKLIGVAVVEAADPSETGTVRLDGAAR